MTPTPLERSPWDDGVWLKREDVHELGAFKWRGALAVLSARDGDVVTASTGNHGAATAWAARRSGRRAVVFVPAQTSKTKLDLLRQQRADVREIGADLDEAKEAARIFARERGLFFFEDGAEPAQLDGYAAIGREIVEQLGARPSAVIVPVGNGALLAGVGRALGASVRRIAVAAEGAPVMHDSWHAGGPVEEGRCETIADGLAVRVAIPQAVGWLEQAADAFVLASEEALQQAVATYWEAGIRAEPAAAAALAVLPQVEERPVVLVVTGRNIDDDLLERCQTFSGSSSAG
jgi:threonine dehydratase